MLKKLINIGLSFGARFKARKEVMKTAAKSRLFTALCVPFAVALMVGNVQAANDIEADQEFQLAGPTTNAIVLDGALGEWPGYPIVNPLFSIEENTGGTPAENLVLHRAWPAGSNSFDGTEADQSSALQVTYDADNLYIGLVVTDDYHQNNNSAWNGDSVQMNIANGARDTTVALYNYALGGSEGALGDVIILHEKRPAGGTDTTAVITRDGNQTIYEICLPKEALGLAALEPGVTFGLGMAINDGDEDSPGQSGWGGLGPHSVVHGKDANHTAEFTLLGPPQTTYLLDFGNEGGNANGTAVGWTAIENLVQDEAQSIGDRVTITALDDGFNPNNTASPGTGATLDGIEVPAEVRDDYLFKINDAAGTEARIRIDGLPAGTYSVTLFEGRTSDANQVAKLWVGEEPAAENTGSFANGSVTLEVTVVAGEPLWYKHLEDNSGGISGMIIRGLGDPDGDDDDDGLPNWFEVIITGDPNDTTGADPEGNNDGDDYTNLEELNFGTDPTDPTDQPVVVPEVVGGVLVISLLDSVVGNLYSLERSTDAINFTTVLADVAGTGGIIEFQDEDPGLAKVVIYRVRVRRAD